MNTAASIQKAIENLIPALQEKDPTDVIQFQDACFDELLDLNHKQGIRALSLLGCIASKIPGDLVVVEETQGNFRVAKGGHHIGYWCEKTNAMPTWTEVSAILQIGALGTAVLEKECAEHGEDAKVYIERVIGGLQ